MTYKMIKRDPLLAPFAEQISLRMLKYLRMRECLMGESNPKSGIIQTSCSDSVQKKDSISLAKAMDWAEFYGFHREENGWCYREWAPGAEGMSLVGDFNGWNPYADPMTSIGAGSYEIHTSKLHEGDHVKACIFHKGEILYRVPLFARNIVQDPVHPNDFYAIISSAAEDFRWTDQETSLDTEHPPLIYEVHIGMSSEKEGVTTYDEFTDQILPRIRDEGYNTIQLMAVMQHSYYASFGYQVTGFYGASSWYGPPKALKRLMNTAHAMGIRVLLDVVHSHASANVEDGLNYFDGTEDQLFHTGEDGIHPAWGTRLFNYGKTETLRFLLSNLRFWMEEYHFDGFRFDGVTSMLYHHHGLGKSFTQYRDYFTEDTDLDAISYLMLANELIHDINPAAITIAEDMSGMPGMCLPIPEGGMGFDYRLNMGLPDFFGKMTSKVRDEDWDIGQMWYELTTRRKGEKTISYCESHDQALVGDKTLMFRMADAAMYWHMMTGDPDPTIARAMELHKMFRLITLATSDGYLNFCGNEFGHPEWIDFPREGNGWSYRYCRRQWSLADRKDLKYQYLQAFDREMIALAKNGDWLMRKVRLIRVDHEHKAIAFARGNYLFVFNFHPTEDAWVDLTGLGTAPYRYCFSGSEDRMGGWMKMPEHAMYPERLHLRTEPRIRMARRSCVVYTR